MQATRWEWQLDFVSPHKLIMHSHDVAIKYLQLHIPEAFQVQVTKSR